MIGGTAVDNVLDNDLLNSDPVNPAEVTISVVTPATDPGVVLNVATGEVTVAVGTPVGTYTIVYRICENLNPGNCDQATVTVPVWEDPSGDFCYNGELITAGSTFIYCSSETVAFTLCDVSSGEEPFDICWEINGAPDCATGIYPGDTLFSEMLPPGVYTVQITSITDAVGHTASDLSGYHSTINIVTGPVVDAGNDASTCEGAGYPLSGATAEQYSSLQWSGGDGTFVPAADVLNPTYEPGPQDVVNGVVTLCLTANPVDPCTYVNSDCMTLTIQNLPDVDAGEDQGLCDNVFVVSLSGSVAGASASQWTTPDGSGFFADPTNVVTEYYLSQEDIDNGSVELCLSATGIDPCSGNVEDCLTVTIDPSPDAFAGDNATICEGESYELSGAFASDYSAVTWSGGDGTFIPGTGVVNPVYEPGPQDISNGVVTLCLEAQPMGLCADSDMDCMTLTIVGIPQINLGPDLDLDCNDYDVAAGEWLPVELTVTAENVQSVIWSTDGDGYFDDPTDIQSAYHLGLNDIWQGDVELCIEAQGEGSCMFTASDCVTVLVPQQLIYYNEDTWWGLSSYLDPDLTTVPEVMDPLVLIPGSQYLVTMINKQGGYFWPEPVPPTNTIGDWSPVGYKIKLKNTPACLPIYGDTLTDQTFEVSGAFTFLPVLTNVPVDINMLFGNHVNDILLIFNWPTGELWTPVASDFDELIPGNAYLLVSKNPGNSYTIEYPDFDPLAPHLYPNTKDDVPNHSPWNNVINTAQPHVILFGEKAMNELQTGDILGAFGDGNNLCFGMEEYQNTDKLFKLIVMGNNPYSNQTDGFESGEQMRFKIYRQNTGETFDVTFTYDETYPVYDGLFAVNGVSKVTGINMTVTSVENNNRGNDVNVFPNPATKIVNITSEQEIESIMLFDYLGRLIFKKEINEPNAQIDVSVLNSGIYTLNIKTNDGYVITRRLSVK
jgi:hypothetical protein